MKIFYLSIIIVVLLSSCKGEGEDQEFQETSIEQEIGGPKLSPNRPNLNISILLDLSDRINPKKYPNPAMEFYERDLGYINSVIESFEWHLRNKRTIQINDHVQLYIDPEPADASLNKKIQSLNITFTKANATKDKIMKASVLFDSITRQIYQSAIEDDNYIGSDIWGFFKSNIKDYCIEDDHRNVLVILTDGYLFHKDHKIREGNQTSYLRPQDIRDFKLNTSKWKSKMEDEDYGFIVSRNDLENLEILVLGINPDPKNPYEQDVIMTYWGKWLKAMGVKDFEIKDAGLPANLDKVIQDYIFKE